MLAVLFYLACVGLFFTISLLGPIFVALLADETAEALRFGFYLLVGGFVFATPMLAILGRLRRISHVGRLMLMALVWTVLPVVCAFPFYDMVGLSPVDALFESVSALTTTGSSTLNSVGDWPRSMLFWRVLLQWLGGYLALLTIIVIIAPLGIGGLTSQRSALSVGADLRGSQSRLLLFATNLGLLYATMTAICSLGFFLSGTRAFHAVSLAMAATSTGGFLPIDKSLDQTINVAGQAVFAIFLVIGATSVFWHRMLLKAQWDGLKQHRESYAIILVVLLLGVMFTVSSVVVTGTRPDSPLASMVQGVLNAASLVATSGIQSQPGYFTLLPLVIVLFVVLVGGGAFSTCGGIKFYRVGGMLVQSWRELDRLIYPNAVRSSHFGSQEFSLDLMKAIWSFFVIAVMVLAIGIILLSASGIPFQGAVTAAIAAFSSAGPVYDAGWSVMLGASWPEYYDMNDGSKTVLMVLMLLGRLEVVAFIGLLNANYWRNR